jgi:hypothetical protein
MVVQEEKIQAFMAKHKEKALERLAMPEHAEEARILYRLTSDLRCVNDRTKLEIDPLPLIAVLLDRTRVERDTLYSIMKMNAASHFATMVEGGLGELRDDTSTPDQKMFVYQN